MITNNSYVNFASGELAPSVWGRTDRPFYSTGLEIMRNFIPLLTGPAIYRCGLVYINHTRLNQVAFLLPFQFNAEQAYDLEFTERKMRVTKDCGVIVETAKTITGITQANPGVITSASHGYNDGDEIYIDSIVGMTELNGQFFIVANKTANTFTLKDIDGNNINTTAYTAYSSGGVAARVYEIDTPYVEADLFQLKMAQTADLGYVVHPKYAPMKLTRSGHASWSLATYTRTADPFLLAAKTITGATQANPGVITSVAHGYETGNRILIEGIVGMTQLNGNSYYVVKINADTFSLTTLAGVAVDTTAYGAYTSGGTAKRENYPGAAGFFGGRLFMGGSDDDPDGMYGSKGPDSTTGQPLFDNFTVGTAAGDAVFYTITSQNGTADRIRWFSGNPKFMVIGTFGGVYKANGGTDGAPITPTAISVAPISSYGTADQNPIYVGGQTVYVEVGNRTLRSFEFDLLSDSYASFDKNILADEITYGGIIQIAFTQGRPDLIWAVRADGVLLSCTFLSREDVAGWARHPVGGNGKVLSIAPDYQVNNFDRLVVCVERVIDGKTRRYLEYISTDPQIQDDTDFYTDATEETADQAKFRNLTFELQKQFIRLDSAIVLDTTKNVTLALSALTGTGVVATAGGATFTAADVGKYIFIKYLEGTETGVGQIVTYNSATEVVIQTFQDFSSLSIATGGWYLLSSTVRGLWHLEGAEVGVVTDGGVHPNKTVTNGEITLDYPARYVIVGYKYLGFCRSLDLEFGSPLGVAQGRLRNIHKLAFKFRNTMGGKYGTSSRKLYAVQKIAYRRANRDYTDRPPLIFSGVRELPNFDDWGIEKKFYFVQDEPQPMTVQMVVPFMDSSVE